MKAWLKTKFGKWSVIGLTVIVVATLAAVALSATGTFSTPSKPVPLEPSSNAEQAAQVTSSGIALVPWAPTEAESAVGYAPVEVLPSSIFLDRLLHNGLTPLAASINPDTHTVSVMMPTSNGHQAVLASVLLDAQLDAVLPVLSSAAAGLEVGGTAAPASSTNPSSTTMGSIMASRYPVNMSSAPATEKAAASTAVSSASNVPETSSPYARALNGAGSSSAAASAPAVTWNNWVAAAFLLGGLFWLAIWNLRRSRRMVLAASGRSEDVQAGKKKKDDAVAEVPSTRFTDVAGCDEAIEEMTELVAFLKSPERFTRVGVTPPRGALLVGPPGTGKTLLARAVAGEAGVPFYAVAGSDFVEMYVGVGAKRVRELFAKARANPEGAIVFIDEIDAVGRARASGGAAVHANTESENTLNALLVEMDGFAQGNVIVLGATNRDDILDAALTRPGRLDRRVQVPLPDRAGRERILAVHAEGRPIAASVDLNLIARRTPGMSGADLAQLVNEACMSAARDDREEVSEVDFDGAVATIAMGKARTSAVVTEHDRLVTAWHEGGHTVAAMVLPDADDPVSVSIIPRGPAGGVTWMAMGDDLFLTRRRAFARLVVAMAGRAAEEILLDGEFTSGPHGDLTAATETAMAMVTQYGMTENGLMILSSGLLSTGSKATDQTIEAVEALLAEALATARHTLGTHLDLLNAVVDGLLENDTLTHADLEAIQDGTAMTAPALPAAPREYRKEKVQAPAPAANAGVVERVRFTDAEPRRRVLRLGPATITFPNRRKPKTY